MGRRRAWTTTFARGLILTAGDSFAVGRVRRAAGAATPRLGFSVGAPERWCAAARVLALASAMFVVGCGSTTSSPADAGRGHIQCTNAAPCEPGLQCVTDWPAHLSAFCSRYNGDVLSAATVCGSYRVFQDGSIETADTYYYSIATGQLVAVVRDNGQTGTSSCVGGPSSFAEPACHLVPLTCADASSAP